ncbi:MAG: lipopolysaccharide biosynthesis protein [Christensenellales bacterium]
MNKIKIKNRLKNSLKKLFKDGFFSIVISQVIVKAISFCSSIFLARILSKGDFGVYSYAQNLLSTLLLLDGIGTISSIIQHASESYKEPGKQASYALYGFKIGFTFNSILSLALFIYALVGSFSIGGTGPVLAIMAFQPILSYVQSFCACNLRFRLETSLFAYTNIMASLFHILSILLGAQIAGVKGIAFGLYIGYLSSILCYLYVFKSIKNIYEIKAPLSTVEKKSFVRMSLSATINDSILHMIMVADVFLIGLLIKDELIVASYKIATTIPTALVFIPASVMLFFYPYFARRQNDLPWIKKTLASVVGLLAVVNGLIVALLYFLAPQFIKFIYGEQYLDCVAAFRILLIGYLFTGTIRTPLVNFLWSQKKNNYVILLSVAIGIVNIVCDVIFIKAKGSIGAAYATMLTYVLSAVLSLILVIIQLHAKKKELKRLETDHKVTPKQTLGE